MEDVDRALVNDDSWNAMRLMIEWHENYPRRDETHHWNPLGLLLGNSHRMKRYHLARFKWEAEQRDRGAEGSFSGRGSFFPGSCSTGASTAQVSRNSTAKN
jgi:hypothetical protein